MGCGNIENGGILAGGSGGPGLREIDDISVPGSCLLVSASIGQLVNLEGLPSSSELEIVVVDEGEQALRRKNLKLLRDRKVRFFGPGERLAWFASKFGSHAEKYASLIPSQCHAETSFAFLLALDEGHDFIIQLDDDAFPSNPTSFVTDHVAMLGSRQSPQVSSPNRWYNTLEMLKIAGARRQLFPRGHPYSARREGQTYVWSEAQGPGVLHMGHWLRVPDLDALTYIDAGFLEDDLALEATGLERDERLLVAPGTYFSVCSMNCSLRREIIPAFYQLYMNYQSVDRFDDIWSGIIVKRIADHLGDPVSLGPPVVVHRKRSRDLFLDLAKEARGMAINEILWRLVDSAELTDGTYHGCYIEMTNHLRDSLNQFADPYRKFFTKQVEMMSLWSEVCTLVR